MPRRNDDVYQQKDRIVQDFYNPSLTLQDIANKYGVSKSFISQRVAEWKLPKRYVFLRAITPEKEKLVIDLYSQEKSTEKVGKKLGLNAETVREFLIRKGINTENKKHAKWKKFFEDKKEFILKSYIEEKKSGWDIAEQLGIKGQTLYKQLNRWGVSLNNFLRFDLKENKETIIKLYTEDKLTLSEIGIKFDAGASHIGDLLKEWGIKANNTTFDTTIERIFEKVLSEELNVKYVKQFKIENRFYDFYLPDFNLIIETNGDYWHGNPKLFKKHELNKIQKEGKIRDRIKKKLARKNGYDIIYIWELDLKNNLDKVRNKIKKAFRYASKDKKINQLSKNSDQSN